MPPLLGAPLAAIFYVAFYYALDNNYVYPFFAGFITGYLVYDMMHYALHHANFSKRASFLNIKPLRRKPDCHKLAKNSGNDKVGIAYLNTEKPAR